MKNSAKKYLLLQLYLLLVLPLMGQNPPVTLPADGNWPTIVGDSIMLIGPKQEALTEEQRYFNPPYLLVYPGKEHLKEQMIRAALCDCDPTKPNRRIGVFSVAPDKQVSFSQGNLQYLPAANIWKFADTQYEYLGNANKYLKPTFRNWVDLFGWSANNTTAPFGVSTSTNVANYAGTFVDWGTNEICGDAPNTWRTLSADEWEYLFEQRKNALQLRSKGSIDGHRGHILLPDDWVLPEGVQFVAQPNNLTMDLDINSYTQAEWSIMEKAGAVFLPAAGRRDGTKVGYLVEYSGVWSSTSTTNTNAFHTYYNYESQIIQHHWTSATSRINGRSVRLVHDTIVPEPIPNPCLVVKVNDTLSINMMCVEGGTFMMGAMESDKQAHANEKPAHQVTLTYDYYIGQTEVTQALWQAVMGNNPSTMIGDDLPVNNVLWEEADAFVKRLSQMTGYTFHLPTEAEWEFAARGGNKSQGYLYAGSNNIQEVAWYGSNSGNTTQPVGTKQPNELGIYDMSGNVIEWCSDWLGPYSAEAQVNPIGPATGAYHVYCGGCWYLPANVCRCTHRRQTTAGYGEAAVGLRVALREKVEPEAVDMGLSVKWANFNIGAFHPTHYGDYFAWGETEPKETYSWENYKWCDGTSTNMTKYNATDGKTILEAEDDAAYVQWGDKWRMPTEEEFTELREKCTWTWTTQDGVKGYKITGPSGNSIFIPAAGFHYENGFNYGENGDYWSAEAGLPNNGIHLNFYPDKQIKSTSYRYVGFTIRPVYDDRPPKRIGVFSVAADKQVSFSQGNLQYIQSTDTWQFAREQYEYIGAANIKDGALADRIDMFGWSANNTTAPFGVSTSTNAADYAGDFVDWGTNTICGNAPNTWRTLSKDEWDYVLNERENAQQLRTKGSVEGKEGVILLPDSWICPEGYTIAIIPDEANLQPNVNTYSQADWSKLEDAGAIILPSAGMRRNAIELEVRHPNIFGGYWTCTNKDEHNSYCYTFHTQDCEYVDYSNHIYGRSVRLVHDTIVPETIPDPCLVVKVNDTLSINMMCVEGGTFQMGATPEMDPDALAHEAPVHSVTLSDYYIGQIEVTQALWKTVMGTNPSTVKDNNRPVNNVSWEDCQVFIEKLNQTTGYSFRLPTEAEWEYAARGGNKSRGYKYAGSDNIDEVAWYKDNSGGKYQPFALKKPNELGIYDMSGNVFEWCQDWYGPYSADAQVNPQGPESGPYHMIRGGGWKHTQSNRVTYRRTTGANLDITSIGLRLVHDTIVPPPEPEYVDLGLSVKWATFNVGATSPEDYGDYFAWGETEPKETYSWATYKWGTSSNLTKYNTTDGKTTLEPEDDAAYVNWGGKWRMPTKEEMHELFDKCTWTEETRNGINGHIVTGPNGNSIFLPIAGFYNKDEFGEGIQKANINAYYWTNSKTIDLQSRAYDLGVNTLQGEYGISLNTRRLGFPIRPVYDDRPTLTVIPTPEDAKVSFLCTGYQAQGHSITVDKGKNVLYQVSNVDAGYLSQGDSIYNLTKDTTLYVTLRPFSDGNWVKVDKSEYTKQEGYYVSRNNGGFASHSVWNYYVLPVLPGETYRVRGIAGQHAALWMAASTAPDPATNTRPTKISCCANRGVAAYVADEVTIPDGAKYLIINSRNGQEMMVERKVPDPCLVVKVNDTLSINLMCVEGGTFRMGAMEGDTQAKENEKPAHEVTLTYDYLIMQTEVTQGLWEAVMGEDIYDLISKSPTPTAKPISTKGDFPVGYVQLSQCLEFIDRLNSLTGLHFRMPSEAEWEYAARGGNKSKGYLYAGSNDITQVAQTSLGTVAKLLPNELGIYDMSGNIAEMTLDYLPNHDTGYPSANAQVNPRQISPTGNRAIRGLRWNTTEINCRISHRNAYTTTYSGNGMGFRLVLSEEQDFRTIHVNGSYFDMSFVKGGTFMMGSDTGEADEQPVHEVTLSDYYIGQTEVTQHLWKKVMGDENNPSATKENNLPVTNITWDEAQTFVERLSELTGMRFRLPAEAEWEYAARGGQKSKGYTYAGSNDIDEVGWYNGNSSNKTHAVGQKQPNELGIYDMTGNVWEYCSDWHMPYSAQAQTNPTGAATGEKHVLRGGCYHYDSKNCTNTNRHSYYTPDKGGASTGLRIVLEPEKN